ncbi:MAG: protease inhibitor I42 family protein [Rhodocyclaceae bacterium]|nr:protease inhibitor I42 family protein [Rhodocyclaceae bacterium]
MDEVTEINLTRASADSRVRVRVGDILVVRLDENPTTGYRWQFVRPDVLATLGDEYSVTSALSGAGGQRVLRFTASSPGSGELILSLRRDWEGAGTAQDAFSIAIEVQ